MIGIIILSIWIVCTVLAYLLFKRDLLRDFPTWTIEDRRVAIALSLLGPIGLIVALIVTILSSLRDSDKPARDSDKPAKW